MIEKCKYYNNAQTACSLMIDDLVPAAVSIDGNLGAHNDWGYLMNERNSLYSYFQTKILSKYPEIKGTIFLPLSSQDYIPIHNGYSVSKRNVDDSKFLFFLEQISDYFEMAFHGNKHEYSIDNGQAIHECANINMEQVNRLVSFVNGFSEQTRISFSGGKFPGYNYNELALEIIKKLHAKWWALQVTMINKIHPDNDISFDNQLNVVLVPTNISGDIFKNHFFTPQSKLKQWVKDIIGYKKHSDPIEYLNYLYKNQYPMTIQEHFQNQKTNGKRQTPNIYDDIWSLDLIYTFLRGKDVWYATCGEIAHYYDSYIHSTIKRIDEKSFFVEYKGSHEKLFLTLKSQSSKIIHIETGNEMHGVLKNDEWIFNNILSGNYRVQ